MSCDTCGRYANRAINSNWTLEFNYTIYENVMLFFFTQRLNEIRNRYWKIKVHYNWKRVFTANWLQLKSNTKQFISGSRIFLCAQAVCLIGSPLRAAPATAHDPGIGQLCDPTQGFCSAFPCEMIQLHLSGCSLCKLKSKKWFIVIVGASHS